MLHVVEQVVYLIKVAISSILGQVMARHQSLWGLVFPYVTILSHFVLSCPPVSAGKAKVLLENILFVVTGIIGKKIGMTSVFEEDIAVPCTIIKVFPCVVTQLKEKEKDGYDAIQLACDEQKVARTTKSLRGHFDKAGVAPQKKVVEFRDFYRSYDKGSLALGNVLKQGDVFEEGEYVDVVGTSKGGGFAGVVKLHNFRGVGDQTHGQHNRQRHPGSIGAGTTPGRVFRGKRMAGRKGNNRVTMENLRILKMMDDDSLMVLKGSVPGAKGSYVILQK